MFFNKEGFSIKSDTNIDVALKKKDTKSKTFLRKNISLKDYLRSKLVVNNILKSVTTKNICFITFVNLL